MVAGESNDHSVLAATLIQRALDAILCDLLWDARVRDIRKPQTLEESSLVSERTQRLESLCAATLGQFRHELSADTPRTGAAVNDERAHFGHSVAERRQLGAADDLAPDGCDHEAQRMGAELIE